MYIYKVNDIKIKKLFYYIIQTDNISLTEQEDDTEIYITKNITVKTIIHSLTPIEYPPTSTAIIYHVEGWQNIEMAFVILIIIYI